MYSYRCTYIRSHRSADTLISIFRFVGGAEIEDEFGQSREMTCLGRSLIPELEDVFSFRDVLYALRSPTDSS